jgi:hypothetical protein
MKRPRSLLLLALPALLAGGPLGQGEVVRPAPSIAFPMDGGKPRTLASFKGQPLILLLADSPNRGAFKDATQGTGGLFRPACRPRNVVAAGFRGAIQSSVRTNVPLVLLPQGPSACAAFQLKGEFAIVLVGPDGNIDYQTGKVLNMNRILEVMQNSYEVQKAAQRGSGGGR